LQLAEFAKSWQKNPWKPNLLRNISGQEQRMRKKGEENKDPCKGAQPQR